AAITPEDINRSVIVDNKCFMRLPWVRSVPPHPPIDPTRQISHKLFGHRVVSSAFCDLDLFVYPMTDSDPQSHNGPFELRSHPYEIDKFVSSYLQAHASEPLAELLQGQPRETHLSTHSSNQTSRGSSLL